MPEAGNEAGVATAQPPAPLGDDPLSSGVSLRRPDGAIRRFDEIITIHPVMAFFFRRRTFIVLLAIFALFIVAEPVPMMLGIAVGLAAIAEAWRIWASGYLHKTEELTTAGPFALVRHPLYVGSFIHAVAYCCMSGRWVSFLVVLPLFLLLYRVPVIIEEQMLLKVHGEEYAEYARRVPRFVPALRLPRPGSGRFSWAQVLANKEYVNVIWVIAISSLYVSKLVLKP